MSAKPRNRIILRLIPSLLLSVSSILLFYRGDLPQTQTNAPYDVYIEGGPPPIHRQYFWDRHKATSCFSLDNICHGKDKWFYRRSGIPTDYQPTISYVQDNVTSTHGYFRVEPRIYFNISASSLVHVDDGTCPLDPTPFHMIVQSAYNDMMGEFYSRSLVALNQVCPCNYVVFCVCLL
jgi:hypothetical protein